MSWFTLLLYSNNHLNNVSKLSRQIKVTKTQIYYQDTNQSYPSTRLCYWQLTKDLLSVKDLSALTLRGIPAQEITVMNAACKRAQRELRQSYLQNKVIGLQSNGKSMDETPYTLLCSLKTALEDPPIIQELFT